MRMCAICERTLLMGERAVRFSPEEGAELVDVCPLCQETALEHGWIKEGTPTTPTIPGDRRRRRRGLGEFLGLHRAGADDTLAPPEPILRRLSGEEISLLEAADLFNASTYRRTVGGIAKSLGAAKASIVAALRRRRRAGGDRRLGSLLVPVPRHAGLGPAGAARAPRARARRARVGFKEWNAHIDDDGRLVPRDRPPLAELAISARLPTIRAR